MTREEAIGELQSELNWGRQNIYPYVSKRRCDALELAIEVLGQEPIKDIKEYYKDIWDYSINHPRREDTVAEIVEKSYMSGYVQGVENTAKEFRFELDQEPCHNLCKSCNTKGCIFQFGIKREKCDFYT